MKKREEKEDTKGEEKKEEEKGVVKDNEARSHASHALLVKEERQGMLTKADQLLATISKRRKKVEAVLEGSASKSDWAAIRRDSTSVSSCLGGLCSNDSLYELRHATEPLLQHFCDDLVAVRTKVTLLLSEQDVNLVGDNLEFKENAATKLLKIIEAIEAMNKWTAKVMTTWVEYHINRAQFKQAAEQSVAIDMLRENKEEATRDDLCQALALWDIKQGQELRGVLSNLLLHYILLEDIVLEAEGSVAKNPKDSPCLHIYV